MASVRGVMIGVCAVAHSGLWWRAAAWYPRLPERIPIHFDIAGKPDGWASRSVVTWFLLPGLSFVLTVLLVTAGLGGVRALARRAPEFINIPRKDVFLTLPSEKRVAALRPMLTFLVYVALMENALFLWIIEGTARVATGGATTLVVWPVAVFVAAILAALVFAVVATHRVMRGLAG